MNKTFSVLIFLFLLIPVNAQRIIKYITFYPVPYGSHENLAVNNKAIINGRDQSETKISGKLAVGGTTANIFDGSLSVNVGGPTIVNVSQQLKSGNTSAGSSFGPAQIDGNTVITNMDGVLLSGNISGAVNAQGNVNIGMESTANLTSCGSAGATWQALRLKGSEECKYYLTCGGGSGDTGCSGAPEAPPENTCEPGYYYSESDKRCLYNSTPKIISFANVHVTFTPTNLRYHGDNSAHSFDCNTVATRTYYEGGSLTRGTGGPVGGSGAYCAIKDNYYYKGWSGGTKIVSGSDIRSGPTSGSFKDYCDRNCPYNRNWFLLLDRGIPTTSTPIYLYCNNYKYGPYPPDYDRGFSTCADQRGMADVGSCDC